MESWLFYGLAFFAFYMLRKNMGLAKRNKYNKEYVKIAGEIFARSEGAKQHVETYISQQKDIEFQNKARILALYEYLHHQQEVERLLKDLDLTSLFTVSKGVSTILFEPKKVLMNSDSMVWSMLVLTKMKAEKREDLIPVFLAKFHYPEEMRKHMEFQLIEALATYYSSEAKDLSLFKAISENEYPEDLLYDKPLIGLYKRLSSFILAQEGVNGEYVEDDVKNFANSSVGKMMMEDLGVDYQPQEKEESQEESQKEEEA